MKTQDKLQEHYADFDFSKATLVEPRLIKKIKSLKVEQENAQLCAQNPAITETLDADVMSWVIKQDKSVKEDINALLRLYMRARMA